LQCSSKVEKEIREYQEAQKLYEEQLEKTRTFQERWEHTLVDIMNHLQLAEEARVGEVKRTLVSFINVHTQHQDHIKKCCEAISKSGVDALEPHKDVEAFVYTSATGCAPPPYPEFQQFELVCCLYCIGCIAGQILYSMIDICTAAPL
jgi:hypothetical protein